MDLTDKVVVVTGGSAGLGEQICYEAAKRGAIVVTCARRINLIGQVKEHCSELSGKAAYAFQLDIADPESVESVIEKIADEVGTVDVLVNNAGFGMFKDFTEFDLADAKKMFDVNVLGMMYFTQKIALSMVEKKRGHIFNVASMAGKMATPKSTIYSATKFAVLGFSNALRLELKPANVWVTTINPGPIATEFFDKADPSGNYLENLGGIVLDPKKVAATIVNKMGKPTREINRPFIMEGASRFYGLFPHIGDFLAGGLFNRK
ncbi:SDR family NAD(P)-dependent oxidoreductase [Enterococcus devriesei]|uniref:Short chain dehydrogenase/reductase family oxidoreductase n=1 Tax=Enterococcus devriesei TaxID=319970 RepID=A0A1L8SY21_9ENTE|nr:SDR family oxidoreductase [Enterococcus devriesei]MBU5364778.1 SDR family oxidoreductase [Enterococcus devriesei]MDT2820343.1 SDR family oxidoreductase [Enterococcus devriesei]OJG36906.1 short chain dehydrogenase/reductase family oxidoreductase [Enterococcus devriesei]